MSERRQCDTMHFVFIGDSVTAIGGEETAGNDFFFFHAAGSAVFAVARPGRYAASHQRRGAVTSVAFTSRGGCKVGDGQCAICSKCRVALASTCVDWHAKSSQRWIWLALCLQPAARALWSDLKDHSSQRGPFVPLVTSQMAGWQFEITFARNDGREVSNT